MSNSIELIKKLCQDELDDNNKHPYDNSVDSFEQGFLGGRLELAHSILTMIEKQKGEKDE